MQYQYRTYLIDLNGSDTYFDHDSEEWRGFDVITQFGGEIVQIIPMARKDLAKFKGWKTTMDRAGGDMANIPAVALVRFAQHSDGGKQPLTATIEGAKVPTDDTKWVEIPIERLPAGRFGGLRNPEAPIIEESEAVRNAREQQRLQEEADMAARRAMINRPSPYPTRIKDDTDQE